MGMRVPKQTEVGHPQETLSANCVVATTKAPKVFLGANVPRNVRARVAGARTANARRRKPVSPQSPPSPNQESVVNPRTGKVAFGPWMGPYESHPDASAQTSMLMTDSDGTHFVSGVAEAPPKPAAAATADKAKVQVLADSMAKHNALIHTGAHARWRLHGKVPTHQKPHGSGRFSAKRSSTRVAINQPRRVNA